MGNQWPWVVHLSHVGRTWPDRASQWIAHGFIVLAKWVHGLPLSHPWVHGAIPWIALGVRILLPWVSHGA